MGLEIDYDTGANVVRVRGRGTVTRDNIEHALRQLRSLALRPGYRELVDLRAVRDLDVTAPYLRRVAVHLGEVIGSTSTDARLAIVTHSEVGFGMARMFELARDPEAPGELRVFRKIAEARQWLGIERPDKGSGYSGVAHGARDQAHTPNPDPSRDRGRRSAAPDQLDRGSRRRPV